MKRLPCLAAALLVVTVMVVAYLPATAAAPVEAPVPQEGSWTMVLPSLAVSNPGLTDLGALPTQTLSVGLALPPVDPTGLDDVIQEVSTPGSPDYGHFLSPSQYQAQFAPSVASVQAAQSYYRSFGLTVTPSGDRMILQVAGPSSAIGSAFHTSFDQYRMAGGSVIYGPTSSVEVPQALGISAVTGFTDYTAIRPAAGAAADPMPTPSPPSSGPSSTAACDPVSGDTPAELQGQYGESSLISAGENGKGETVGIVDAYDSAETQSDLSSQLTSFSTGCGLVAPKISFLYPTRTTANLNSTPSTGWGGETILDIETVHSLAPGATIDLTLAADSALDVYEAVDFLVAFNLTQTISMSWGEPDMGTDYEPPQSPCLAYYSCNASADGSYDFLHPIFAEAVAEGITPFSAAGDCGAYDGTGILTTDYPGSDPYVTDVGGTQLNSSGTTYGGETGWSGTGYECTANTGGGGGGYAPFPRPWYQSGEGLSSTNSRRGAPDVAASAADGTSEATPIWAGLTAVGDELHGSDLGLLGPSLYAILRTPSEYASDFHDILVGNNGYACGRGWSPVTGLGSPDIGNLLPDLWRYQPSTVGTMSATLSASPGNTAAETFTATVTGGVAPYHYDFVPGLYLGQWAGTNSSLAYTYTGTGAFFATVEVWDSTGNWTESPPVLVDIGGTTLTGTLTPSTTSALTGVPVTFTTAASGGTTPYSYTYLWGDGSYGYNASATDAHAYETPGTYCPSVEVVDAHSPADAAVLASACLTVIYNLHASLAAAPGSGNAPLTVSFTEYATGGTTPYSYVWSYGDGTPNSMYADPTHTYNTSGTFPVVLTVTDSAARVAYAYTNITVSAAGSLAVSISATPTTGAAPLAVAFSSTPSGGSGTYTYAWRFGDGSTSTTQNPSHTYSAVGLYAVVLNVSDTAGHVAHAYTNITVTSVPALVPAAKAAPTQGVAPLAVAFNGSASGGKPGYSFSWNFGDGSSAVVARNPTHTYTAVGTFTVTLTVTDQQPVQASTTLTVDVLAPLTGTASAAPSSGTAPLDVTFNATAAGGVPAYAWKWAFGDGGASTVENPSHAYSEAGSYTARMWVNDSAGDTFTATVAITVAPATPLAISVGGDPEVAVGASEAFWAAASGGTAPYAFSWNFDDGSAPVSTGAVNTTSHTYAGPGTYEVIVTVTDSVGAQLVSSPFTVHVTSGTALGVRIGGLSAVLVNQSASFWAVATGGAGGYTYTWTFGDGTSSAASSSNTTDHSYPTAGNFDVLVTVHDAAGAQASSSVLEVTVSAAPVSSPTTSSSPFLSGGSLSLLGWLVVAAVVAAVAILAAAFLLRRREPPSEAYDAGPGPGAPSPSPAPGPGLSPYAPPPPYSPPTGGSWAPPPPP